MKFKLNITKTGLPDGEIIVGDWYEGNDPILTWNPLMTLNGRNGEKEHKLAMYRVFSSPDYGRVCVLRIFSLIFVFGYILSGTCKSI